MEADVPPALAVKQQVAQLLADFSQPDALYAPSRTSSHSPSYRVTTDAHTHTGTSQDGVTGCIDHLD